MTYSTAGLTGTTAIAADTTQVAGYGDRCHAAGTASTASVQASATLNAAGIGQLATGDTLTFQLGSGTTVTATFGASADATTNTFGTAAGLISVLNTGTGASGNLSTEAFAASDGAGGVTVTSYGVTSDFTLATPLPVPSRLRTLPQLPTLWACADGFRRYPLVELLLRSLGLPAGAAAGDAAAGVFHSAADLVTSVNAGQNTHATITASATNAGNGLAVVFGRRGHGRRKYRRRRWASGPPPTNSNYNATLSALLPAAR